MDSMLRLPAFQREPPARRELLLREQAERRRRYNAETIPMYRAGGAVFEDSWDVVKPPEGSVRKLKRRFWVINSVVKKLPGSLRTGFVTDDFRLVYGAMVKLRQTLPRRRMLPGILGKYIRSKTIKGKKWFWRKRRRRK